MGVRTPSRRSSATTSHPSFFGSMISTMRRSNLLARACSRPVSPSRATSTVNPASRSPLAKKAAVFFSSSITKMRIGLICPIRPWDLRVARRWQGNHQPGKQKCDCRREQAIAAVGVQQECLHIQEPERGQKHRADNQDEKDSRARISERGERGESEYAEVGHRAQQGHWYAAHFRIGTAQYPETIWRSSATERLAGERLHG